MDTIPTSPAAGAATPGASLPGQAGGQPGASTPGTSPGTPGATLLSQMGADTNGTPGTNGTTLLSQMGAEGGEAPAPESGQNPAPAMPDAAPPDSPDGYSFDFGPDVAVNNDLLGEFKGIAHKLGLTGEQAQSLADFYADRALEMTHKQQMQTLLEARMRWEDELKRSPGYAEDRVKIATVLKQFGSPELYELFDMTNIGSHPLMFKFLADVGRAIGEPAFVGGGASPARSAASKLYPDMA